MRRLERRTRDLWCTKPAVEGVQFDGPAPNSPESATAVLTHAADGVLRIAWQQLAKLATATCGARSTPNSAALRRSVAVQGMDLVWESSYLFRRRTGGYMLLDRTFERSWDASHGR
jgi:hypothetical protein